MSKKKISYITFEGYNRKTKKQNGYIIFSDGTLKKVKRKQLVKYLVKFAKQESITSIDKLLHENEKVIRINKKNKKDIITNLLEKAKPKEKSQKKSKTKTKKRVVRGVIATLCVCTVTSVCSIGYKLFNKNDKRKNTNIEKETTSTNKFSNMSYSQLIDKTSNINQAHAMTSVGNFLDSYNVKFANNYIENGKNIKAALNWDETMSIKLALNNYSNNQISNIFNGVVNGESLNKQYSNAFESSMKQLTMAYVLEDFNNQISLDTLIDDQKGKAFYNQYNELFIKCKNSSGNARKVYLEQLSNKIKADFSVDQNNVQLSTTNMDPYKLSIMPMLTASQVIFSNDEFDHSILDAVSLKFSQELKNTIDNKYTQYDSAILLNNSYDSFNPEYYDFKDQKEKELLESNNYNTDNNSRNLSKLDRYNKIIGTYNKEEKAKKNDIQVMTNNNAETKSHNNSQNKTKEYKDTEKVENNSQEKELSQETQNTTEQEINKETEIPNQTEESKQEPTEQETTTISEEQLQKERESAEQEANEKASEMQDEEESKRDEIESEISSEEESVSKEFDSINDSIDQEETVNSKDLEDSDIIIDDEYLDENGNISDSVKDIEINNESFNNEELSNEEIAEIIVEEMANSEEETTDIEKVYVK